MLTKIVILMESCIIIKHYRAKPSVQLPKHMHILLDCCYKLADKHLTLFQLHIRVVKAVGIIHAALLLNRARVTCKPQDGHCTILCNQPAMCATIVPSQQIQAKKLSRIAATLVTSQSCYSELSLDLHTSLVENKPSLSLLFTESSPGAANDVRTFE